jgi:phospholipid/cholesterol/gamma-HCH transport system substrate-binding protein
VVEHTKTEIAVGAFVILAGAAFAFVVLSLGTLEVVPRRYAVSARFAGVGDLKRGASVKLAGVSVGVVQSIKLADYAAEVELAIDREVKLPLDTIASIRVLGLLGDSYVCLSPGASEKDLGPGGRIEQTQPPLDLIGLLAKYIFGSGGGSASSGSREKE